MRAGRSTGSVAGAASLDAASEGDIPSESAVGSTIGGAGTVAGRTVLEDAVLEDAVFEDAVLEDALAEGSALETDEPARGMRGPPA